LRRQGRALRRVVGELSGVAPGRRVALRVAFSRSRARYALTQRGRRDGTSGEPVGRPVRDRRRKSEEPARGRLLGFTARTWRAVGSCRLDVVRSAAAGRANLGLDLHVILPVVEVDVKRRKASDIDGAIARTGLDLRLDLHVVLLLLKWM